MNDAQIRNSFHRKILHRHHAAPDTLVIEELGLKHGRGRADIAVINGRLIGYEIKSDDDSLRRLGAQVEMYDAVFDRATVVAGGRYLRDVERMVPCWWGVVATTEGRRGAIHFETVRRAAQNPTVDDFSIAQLLWRDEVKEELMRRGVSRRILRQKRAVLYRELVDILAAGELRRMVREHLKSRTDWRCPRPPSPGDGSSQPSSTS